jgi:stress response protein YsnF
MTQQVITAFFDNRSDASAAVEELVKAGIPRAGIKLMPETEGSVTTPTRSSNDTNKDEKGFWASLEEFFFPEEDRHTYAEAMHRSSIMVSATVDAAHAERAEDILEKYGTVNIEEREASWRKEGWTGYPAGATAGRMTGTTATNVAGATARTATAAGVEVIPVVEEQLRVGKRQVNQGRVRVRSYVVETPVQEQVNLRQEHVNVERRAVDRPVMAADALFRERTIDAEERSE